MESGLAFTEFFFERNQVLTYSILKEGGDMKQWRHSDTLIKKKFIIFKEIQMGAVESHIWRGR